VTNAVGRWKARKDRRCAKALRPEHDFSVATVGIMVIGVVVAVMFSV